MERLRPYAHVFGHTHWHVDTTIKGVRYVQCPLGNPRERDQTVRGLKINPKTVAVDWFESPPLALIWSGDGY